MSTELFASEKNLICNFSDLNFETASATSWLHWTSQTGARITMIMVRIAFIIDGKSNVISFCCCSMQLLTLNIEFHFWISQYWWFMIVMKMATLDYIDVDDKIWRCRWRAQIVQQAHCVRHHGELLLRWIYPYMVTETIQKRCELP